MVILIPIIFFFSTPGVADLRNLYHEAYLDKQKANQLFEMSSKQASSNNLFLGYEGASEVILAKHAFSPISKWRLFSKGKDILETAIARDTTSAELRFLRLSIQDNCPWFLGYRSMIE